MKKDNFRVLLQQQNHPKRGSIIYVSPITELSKVAEIKALLKDHPRNLALFTLGINTNLRASDLLNLKVGQLRNLKVGDEILVQEIKTGKKRRISLNSACIEALAGWLAYLPHFKDHHYVFVNRQGGRLIVASVNHLVKLWCRKVGLTGNYGSHTLRKTWGYMQYHEFHVPLPHLMVCFNHSSQRQTLDYLGITPEEIKDVYANVI